MIRSRSRFGLLVGALVLLIVAAFATGAAAARETWEYKVELLSGYKQLPDQLNTAGADGWELILVTARDGGGSCLIYRRAK